MNERIRPQRKPVSISSKVLPPGSGMRSVAAAVRAIVTENKPRTPGSPIFWVTVPNAKAVSTAPHLPIAAEMPCAVPLTRAGNTSQGNKNVVQFGPTQATSCESPNMTIRPAVEVCADGTDMPAQIAYRTHPQHDMYSCCRMRPMESANGMPM